MSWVYTLNGWCSGICGEASYREKHLTLAERGRNGRLKINGDDDDLQCFDTKTTVNVRASTEPQSFYV